MQKKISNALQSLCLPTCTKAFSTEGKGKGKGKGDLFNPHTKGKGSQEACKASF